MTRLRAIATGVAALLALALITVGVPVLLARIGAIPTAIPDPSTVWQALITPDRSGRAVFVVLAALTWTCWGTFTASVVREVAAAIHSRGRRPAPPVRGLSWSAWPAAVLVGAVVAMIMAAPMATMTAPPAAAAPTPAAAMHAVPAAPSPTPPTDPATDTTTAQQPATTSTTAPGTGEETVLGTRSYTVARHDSLWSIAARQLGQPRRWVEIVDLNPQIGPDHVIHAGQVLTLPAPDPQPDPQPSTVTIHRGDTLSGIAAEHGHRHWQDVWTANAGRAEPGGDRFTDPNHIEPGWTITLPTTPTATSSSATATPGGEVSPFAPEVTPGAQVTPGAAGAAPAPSTTPAPTQQPAPQPAPAADAAPTTPVAAAPTQASAAGSEVTSGADQGEQHLPPVAAVVGLFAAGGLVLGASAWGALLIARRQRFRHRVPGRGFTAAAPQLVAVERAVSAVGAPAVDELARLDEVLRRLAASDIPQLALAAVAVTGAEITVHFTDPVTLPGPWTPATGDPTQVRDTNGPDQGPPSVAWRFPADAPTATAGPDPADMTALAPFPTLVTLGTDGHRTWLLDLERAGGLTLSGDEQACLAVGRAMAAQLGLTPWSEGATITLVGFGHQLVDLNPERMRYATCAQAPRVMAAAAAQAAGAVRYASHGDGREVPTIRRDDTEPEAWPPQVLLVAPEAAHTTHRLRELIDTHPARTATAVVMTGTDTSTDATHSGDAPASAGAGLVAVVAADGTLTLPEAGLTLSAHRWDEDTAGGVARLLCHARDAHTAPIPPADGPDEWTGLADQAGAIRQDLVEPRATPAVHEADPDADTCLLPLADEVYLATAASTVQDLQVLAPNVPAQLSDAIHEIDPGLDADLAAWFDPHCPRPRLTLLGPLTIRTRDEGGRRRLAYYTEVIAYLATREHGATVEQLADAFTLAPATARKYVHVIRHLLGQDPDTQAAYLPDADQSPAGKARGVPTYQIRGILVDADLFRRLRLRGQARGQDGISDLATALQLVTGAPFSQMRPGGGEWVIEGDRIDHHLTHAITDVAHLITTHALAAGDLAAARAATEIARVAAPYEEITRLDAIAIDTASGDTAQARRALLDEVCNRRDDHGAPLELSERTQRILTQHADWLTRAS